MTDREKVIRGFECCHVMVHDLGPDKSSCGICPYKDIQTEEQIDLGGIECIACLHDDALALLKEQPEIVRCQDCKHSKMTADGDLCKYCEMDMDDVGNLREVYHSAYWYCADGKRKEGR